MRTLSSLFPFFVFVLFASILQAGTIHVPVDFPTIQAGIDAAINGDVVMVTDGVWTGEGNYNISLRGKAITVTSQCGPENCIIDCQGNGRAFTLNSGEGPNSIIQGFTIRNGYVTGSDYLDRCGGAVFCDETSPQILNNIIHDNYAAENGAGIFIWRISEAVVSGNIIFNNVSDNQGGGIYCQTWRCSPPCIQVFSNNVIKGNVAWQGGGFLFGGFTCDPVLINNTVVDNIAGTGGGGGLWQADDVHASITNSIFWGNESPVGGKELWIDAYAGISSVSIEYSVVEGGQASVYLHPSCGLTWGDGVIDVDPLFADVECHLQESSPCIDSGDPSISDTCLLPGLGTALSDMGAYGGEENCEIEYVYCNSCPVADAGADQPADEWDEVTLDGSGSYDPDEDPLGYSWTQIGGTLVDLYNADTAFPDFEAPTVPRGGETLTFELTVHDGECPSDPSIVNVTVINVNHPPMADGGDSIAVSEGSMVTLDGTNSYDEDGEEFTYYWDRIAGPAVILSDPADSMPFFESPDVGPDGALLIFELTVCDVDTCTSDTVMVFVEYVNHPPVANAGNDQTKDEGNTVTLNGTGSRDPDSDQLSYSWSQVSGPREPLSDDTSPTPWFTAPLVDDGGAVLTYELTVSDGEWSDTDQVVITVQNFNDPPRCDLAYADVETFWPPNHKMVEVAIIGVADPQDDDVTITVTGVTQDEPTNGLGDGDTSPDAVIQGDGKVLIRAERAGGGNGRVYVIHFEAWDDFGEGCSGSVTVKVPHDRKDTNIPDDGQVYDSLQP